MEEAILFGTLKYIDAKNKLDNLFIITVLLGL